MTAATDRALARRLAIDVDAAFPDLVLQTQDALFGTIVRLVGDHADAEDLSQEVFVRAYRSLCTMESDRIAALTLRAWLWTIALNRCRTFGARRAQRPRQVLLDPEWVSRQSATPSPADRAAEQDWTARLAALNGPQRTAVVLRHVGGLSYGEIAQATDRPIGTVKADVHRGVRALRAVLETEASKEAS